MEEFQYISKTELKDYVTVAEKNDYGLLWLKINGICRIRVCKGENFESI